MTVRYLTLVLTTACNLNCVYCYRGETTDSQTMLREVAEKSLWLVAASRQSFHVQLTGGEPTLEPELVEWVVSAIRRANWPATVALQTNGTHIDRALIRLCERYHIQIGVSVDGPPHIQNLLRGNAEATIRGLNMLAEAEVPVRITTVVTNRNVTELGRLVLLLSTFPNVKGLGLDLLVQKGQAQHNQMMPPSPLALKQGITELLKRLNQVNDRRNVPIVLRERELLQKAFSRKKHKKPLVFCHACKGESLAIHPDGTLYPCGQTVGDPHFACGTLDAPNISRLTILSADEESGMPVSTACAECLLKSFCPGDCPSRQYYNTENGSGLVCLMYRTLWEHYTKIR